MDFVAIDFETATGERSSACSVAVVEIRNSKIYDSFYRLIKPPSLKFNYMNIQIHGITPEAVRNEPQLPELWPELCAYLENKIVVAHNAAFDMGVLRGCLEEYQLAAPVFQHCCTVSIARRVWPELPNHKLNTLGDYFGLKFRHHHALADAKACAKVALLAAEEYKATSVAELLGKINVPLKDFAGWEAK